MFFGNAHPGLYPLIFTLEPPFPFLWLEYTFHPGEGQGYFAKNPFQQGRVRKFPVFRSGAPYGRHGPRKAGGPVSRPYITKRRSF